MWIYMYLCVCVCVGACECVMQIFFSKCMTIDGTLAKILAKWKVNLYENIYLLHLLWTKKNVLWYSKWREKNSSVKKFKKKITTFTQNCLFMNSPSNTCKYNRFTTIITNNCRRRTSGGSSSNSDNNNTRRNQLLVLLKTFDPFLVHTFRVCIYWIIDIIHAKLSNAHFNSSTSDFLFPFLVNLYTHRKKFLSFMKDFVHRINWTCNQNINHTVFFNMDSQFIYRF